MFLALVTLTYVCSFADVYSTVIRFAQVEGYTDCWKIEYALFEDHDTPGMNDDTHMGTYSVVVGSDCTSAPGGGLVESEDDEAIVEAAQEKHYDFDSYPNPVNNEVRIEYTQWEGLPMEWSWNLVSEDNVVVRSGKVELSGTSEFTLNTSSIRPGRYALLMISSKGDVEAIQILVVK